jgi:uncharacterized protein YjbI with pentapeptide repeats
MKSEREGIPMSEQQSDITVTADVQTQLAPDGYKSWNEYWAEVRKQQWRTEPKIEKERKDFLARRRDSPVDIKAGIYPFRDENGPITLTRADVEWLLDTHESGGMRGPVDWSDEKQRLREGIDLRGANLSRNDLSGLPLAKLCGALPLPIAHAGTRHQRRMASIHLESASLHGAHLEGADLNRAFLQDADLSGAQLEQTVLYSAHLEGANLNHAHLAGADLQYAFFDEATSMHKSELWSPSYGGVSVMDTRWNGVSLSRTALSDLPMLGDEEYARYRILHNGKRSSNAVRLDAFVNAVQANRQFAQILRSQGLNEDADRFAYRAQLLQQQVLRRQRKFGAYLFSRFIDGLAGYGYKPVRSLIAYLLLVTAFAAAYYVIGLAATPHLQWYEALVVSLTAFHGRGFFSQQFSPGAPQSILAASEAVVGLIIEISFIATFTQRFFGR